MFTTWSNYSSRIAQVSALLALSLLTAASSNAQLPKPGQPVSLYLTVEKGSDLVQGLNQNNFRLFEKGQARQFRLERPETPASVALLVENSQTAYYYYWDDIQAAVEGFLGAAPEGNWYALASFGHDLHVDVDFTKRIGRIRAAFSELQQPAWSDVDIYDAIYGMLEKMGPIKGRKVLIAVGMGIDSGLSSHTLEDVLHKAESVNVTVYGVAMGSYFRGQYEPYLSNGSRMDLLQARSFFQSLAEKTGGQAWFPLEQGAYRDIMNGVMQSLANQYRLVYTPEAPAGKFDKIKVEAFRIVNDKREDFKVRVREGWQF